MKTCHYIKRQFEFERKKVWYSEDEIWVVRFCYKDEDGFYYQAEWRFKNCEDKADALSRAAFGEAKKMDFFWDNSKDIYSDMNSLVLKK